MCCQHDVQLNKTRKGKKMTNPKTVKEAVDRMINKMSEEEKQKVKKTPIRDLPYLHSTLGRKISNGFGLWSGNKPLVADCMAYQKCKGGEMHPDDASFAIMTAIHVRLSNESKGAPKSEPQS
jgi:hypothetical protein